VPFAEWAPEEIEVVRALLVDGDWQNLQALAGEVANEGFATRSAESLEKARLELGGEPFDLVLAELELPDGSALDLVPALEDLPRTELVLLSSNGSTRSASAQLRGASVECLEKPLEPARLRRVLRGVLRTVELRDEVDSLRGELRRLGRFGAMVGASVSMQRVYDQIVRVAPTKTTVFIVGGTGSGKELVAESIHALSSRSRGPFLPVDCGAISPTLIESELFGHEKGAFTGATQRRYGLFERASGGTLFLDEITEMPLELQTKLLRALETRRIRRIGSSRLFDVDVRVIAATNCQPEAAVAQKKLREDLLYRLLVFPIHLPPLCERDDDLVLIATHILDELNQQADSQKRFSEKALARLRLHSWPGNVRELKNVVERAFLMASDEIGPGCLEISGDGRARLGEGLPVRVGMTIREAERHLILATLEHLEGDKRRAAQTLGISLKTLYNRLNEYAAG
jgi:DNA-binding NtrC family response regulator